MPVEIQLTRVNGFLMKNKTAYDNHPTTKRPVRDMSIISSKFSTVNNEPTLVPTIDQK